MVEINLNISVIITNITGLACQLKYRLPDCFKEKKSKISSEHAHLKYQSTGKTECKKKQYQLRKSWCSYTNN